VIGFRNPLPGSFQDLRTIEDLFREDIQTKPFTVKLKANYYEEDEKISKQDLLKELQSFFEEGKGSRKHFILVLSGHSDGEKYFIYFNKEIKKEYISYKEVADVWINRKYKCNDNSQHLLILIDACYSGVWVKQNEEKFHYGTHIGITVLSSCDSNVKSRDHPENGGSLIFGFKALNTFKYCNEIKSEFKEYISDTRLIKYLPRLSGFYIEIKKDTISISF
jgi:hypothetical protein